MNWKNNWILISGLLIIFCSSAQNITDSNDSLERLLPDSKARKKFGILKELIRINKVSAPEKALYFADQLIKEAIANKEKKEEINGYNAKGMILMQQNDFKNAASYYLKSLEASQKIRDQLLITIALNNLGEIYFNWSKFEEALEYYQQVLEIYKKSGDRRDIANTTNNIAVIYKNLSKYEKALSLSQESLRIFEELGEKKDLPVVYDNIGGIYFYWNNYEKALEYYNKSLDIQKELDNKKGIANSLNNIGVVHKNAKNYERALQYIRESLDIYEELGNKKEIAKVYNNMGSVYFAINDLNKALEYSIKSLKIKEETGDQRGVVISLRNTGDVYSRLGNYTKAIEHYSRSQEIAIAISQKEEIMNNYKAFSDIYVTLKDYQKAYDNFKNYYAIKDSIFNEKSAHRIAELQTKYETEKKDRQIAQQNLNETRLKQDLKKQKTLTYFYIFLIILIFLFVIILLRLYRRVKKNEFKLQESEEKFRRLFEDSDDIFLILEGNSILDANDAAIKLFNYSSKEQFLTMDLDQLSPERQSDGQFSREKIERMIRAARNNGYNRFEWVHKKSDGELFFVDTSLTSVELQGKSLLYAVIRDVTEQKHAEAELEKHRNHLEELVRERTEDLERAKEKAEESDRLKTAFLANMSHEIRTPMNAIIGFSGLLTDPNLSLEDKKEFINHINNNSNNLLNLIDDIIDISKIEAGQINISITDCLVNEILAELFTTYLEDISRKGKSEVLDLRFKPSINDKNINILSDPYRFRQIMSNLLGNAIKFTDRGYVEYGYDIDEKEEFIHFYVKDTGIGISEEKLHLVFDRFRQIEDSNTRKYGGTGLGLTISKNLVKLLGGEMWVESEAGKGSRFIFTLPFKPAEGAAFEDPSAIIEKDEYDWSGKVILVAEDIDINYLFIEKALKDTKVKLLWAHDGQEAVDMCSKSKIDLVLMDIRMPVMDGYEATRKIKKIRNNLPVIAQTAHALSEEKVRSLQAGCDDYIAKPIKLKTLYSIINKYLSNNTRQE